jgi:multisubunit Na+/H+ antiporter MnhC subunit
MWLTPAFGDSAAHVLSALMLSAIVIVVARLAIVWLHPYTANEALLIGDEWVPADDCV